jgi:hypothetical protein
MVRVVWIAKDVTAFMHEILAKLFGARFCIVVGRAQRSQPIESRERLTTVPFAAFFRDRGAMIDHLGRCNFTNLQARLTQRMCPQFKSA